MSDFMLNILDKQTHTHWRHVALPKANC